MAGVNAVNDQNDYNQYDDDEMLSPLRPERPDEFKLPPRPQRPSPKDDTEPEEKRWATEPESASERLNRIREKMETVANEYANREISRAQFNAIYGHYREQRAIIEKIISRDPKNDGWKQAARSGKTAFLREHFEARPLNYVVYIHHNKRPLMGGGERPDMKRITGLLKSLWSMQKMRVGVARLAIEPPNWLIMCAGYYGVTFVTFHLEPSGIQANSVRDLHNDFERANRLFFQRGKINKAQMVFPQRSLIESL